jgi:recombination protein RecA
MAPPFKQAEFDVLFAEGISKTGELVDLGTEKRILEKSGAWYAYKGERLGQGRDAVREFLKNNPAVAKEIEQRLREGTATAGRVPEKKPEPRAEERRVESRSDERRVHAGRNA